MSYNDGSWCLIESDPGVFSELIKEFGCTGVQVEEIWSLDSGQFVDLKPVHGLIFLFKWIADDEPSGSVINDSRLEKIFFAKQSNIDCKILYFLGIARKNFVSTHFCTICANFKKVSRSETIRRQTLYELDNKNAPKDENVYHFVGYVPIDGRLYELDGLKEGPVDLGLIPPNTEWTEAIRPVIQKRINKYQEGEIHFNLLAIISDLKIKYEKRLAELTMQVQTPASLEEAQKLQQLLTQEEEKRKAYSNENIRRKHNYLPLIVEILKILASQGQLLPLYEKAKAKVINAE
ncbi:unnamed protein product [Nesidiocoris tenuis]|uniref:Ubiquitin carboxyl-terminal hydrolase calypso n=1 Tax=Nesidiocoris tenuis TaxID=355587 RepID=A0A6H5GZ75_9HEMI|nr:unnamed protein product [Nesidiocoris tenuis]